MKKDMEMISDIKKLDITIVMKKYFSNYFDRNKGFICKINYFILIFLYLNLISLYIK